MYAGFPAGVNRGRHADRPDSHGFRRLARPSSHGWCDASHLSRDSLPIAGILWHGSQTGRRPVRILSAMSAKYYTQFRLNDANYRGGNEFSGVIELNRPIDKDWDVADIEAVLARNFDLQQSAVTLLSWSRLH